MHIKNNYESYQTMSEEDVNQILRDFLVEAMKTGIKNQKHLQKLKNKYSLRHKISSPSNVALIRTYRELLDGGEINENKEFFNLIKKRKVRSQSGIANITVLTKAFACPGKCVFCPTEPDMPKSYLSNEPAMMRAVLNDFDGFNQTKNRLEGLRRTGHPTDKIEVIVSGGTFSFYPKHYQTSFVRSVFNALNEDGVNRSLAEAQKVNEKAPNRCIGLSVETRPDWITEKEVKRFRILGATKIEIGLQSLDDGILYLNKRGHGVAESRNAMKLLKDGGFKINAHMMPNLVGSTPEKDVESFKMLFEDPDFRPDWLKLYPTVVTPYTELEKIWKKGGHKPYTDKDLSDLIVKLKQYVPEYTRIARLYRDIPAESILAGSKISNLRQLIQARMAAEGVECRCIRCREIREEAIDPKYVELVEREYDSSDGKEHFLAFEETNKNKIIAFLRLRIPSQIFSGKLHFIQELQGCALIREIHTYGTHLKISQRKRGAAQHKGYGSRLLERAEEIAREKYGIKKLAVISGIGVREYYRKRGYNLAKSFMVKNI